MKLALFAKERNLARTYDHEMVSIYPFSEEEIETLMLHAGDLNQDGFLNEAEFSALAQGVGMATLAPPGSYDYLTSKMKEH